MNKFSHCFEILTCLFAIFLLTGCVSQQSQAYQHYKQTIEEERQERYARNYNVVEIENGVAGAKIYEINSKEQIIDERLESLRVNFASEQDINERKKYLEENAKARIMIEVSSSTIEYVSSPNFNIIIRSPEGETVNTCTGPHDVANGTTLMRSIRWWNFISCSIPSNVDKNFEIFIVDKIASKRNGYVVTAQFP